MIRTKHVEINAKFVGRYAEVAKLQEIGGGEESQILVVFGRRRVGKTELLEQTFRERNIIKIEGIQGLPQEEQLASALRQLSEYLGDPLTAKLKLDSWSEFFQILHDKIPSSAPYTLYLEEVQWLANYDHRLIAELKYVWDNFLRHKPGFLLILCGSAPSFMLTEVLRSKALYNRSQHQLHLKPFSLKESAVFMGPRYQKSQVLDAQLTVGGIPEYLQYLKTDTSVMVALCKHSFLRDSFFCTEYERTFTSSLAGNKHYKKIVELLSKNKFLTRGQLVKGLGRTSGGDVTELLEDLILCGFIERYHPFHLSTPSKLARYRIADCYLQFFYKFIKPILPQVENGSFDRDPVSALNRRSFDTWLGFAFERLCLQYERRIARLLEFSGIHYRCGTFFNRGTNRQDPGFQWDLAFDRDDRVLTLCEIKYQRSPVTEAVISEFERKLALLPVTSHKAVQRVLIASAGASRTLHDSGYFDRIITAEELFEV